MASVSPAQAGLSPAGAGRADTSDLRETLSSPVSFSAITEDNVGQLRRLNAAILPVRYGDKFYRDVINTPLKLTKFGKCPPILLPPRETLRVVIEFHIHVERFLTFKNNRAFAFGNIYKIGLLFDVFATA